MRPVRVVGKHVVFEKETLTGGGSKNTIAFLLVSKLYILTLPGSDWVTSNADPIPHSVPLRTKEVVLTLSSRVNGPPLPLTRGVGGRPRGLFGTRSGRLQTRTRWSATSLGPGVLTEKVRTVCRRITPCNEMKCSTFAVGSSCLVEGPRFGT